MNRRGTLLCLILIFAVFLCACGHAEIESTILTTAPAQSETYQPPETTAQPETEPTTVPEPSTEPTEPVTASSTEPTTAPATEPVTEEPTAAPPAGQTRDYVLNNNSKKFHFPDCSSAKQIKESNRSDFHGTRQELLDRGYSPCGRCKP